MIQMYRKGKRGLQKLEGCWRSQGPGSSGHRDWILATGLQSPAPNRYTSLLPGALSRGPRPIFKGPLDISTWIHRLLVPQTHVNSPSSFIKISPWIWLLNFFHENPIFPMIAAQNLSPLWPHSSSSISWRFQNLIPHSLCQPILMTHCWQVTSWGPLSWVPVTCKPVFPIWHRRPLGRQALQHRHKHPCLSFSYPEHHGTESGSVSGPEWTM